MFIITCVILNAMAPWLQCSRPHFLFEELWTEIGTGNECSYPGVLSDSVDASAYLYRQLSGHCSAMHVPAVSTVWILANLTYRYLPILQIVSSCELLHLAKLLCCPSFSALTLLVGSFDP